MWPLTTVKLPVVTLLASARANVTNGSRLLGYTLLSPSRNYFILKKEPESWHLALSAKKEVNVTVTAWQEGVTSDRLTSVQLANVTWLPPPPPLHERSAVNLLLFILRESGSLLGNLCLHVVRQRFDVCPAALVFQDAFYRPGSCHSHTLTDCHAGCLNYFYSTWFFPILWFLPLSYQKQVRCSTCSPRHNSVLLHEVGRKT